MENAAAENDMAGVYEKSIIRRLRCATDIEYPAFAAPVIFLSSRTTHIFSPRH